MLAESDSKDVRELCPEEVRERTDALDALGNTTAAVGKGFAAGCKLMAIVSLVLAKPICSPDREWWHGAIAAGACVLILLLIQWVRKTFGVAAPDFQKNQYPMDRPMESRAALVQTLKADIDNAQKKTKECMTALEEFTGETGVYNHETGQLDMTKFQAMRDKIAGDLKAEDEKKGQEAADARP